VKTQPPASRDLSAADSLVGWLDAMTLERVTLLGRDVSEYVAGNVGHLPA